MSKILITGANGFIGSHLVDLLISEGIKPKDLRLLIPKSESLKNLPLLNFDILWGDIRDKKTVEKAVRGVNVVYHLAAKTVTDGSVYEDYFDINVGGTQNLLDACLGKKIQKFVYFSSIAVFGLPAYVGEILNWNENRPKCPAEPYGESKLEAEKRVISFCVVHKLPYAIIRPTTVYGPRDHQGILELYKAIKGHYYFQIGDGENLMDYVYVGDLVKGARLAQMSNKKAGDYILGCVKPLKLREIVESVAKSIDEPVSKLAVSKTLAMCVSYPFWILGKIIGIRSPIFPNRVRILTTNCYFDSSKAQKEIGYNPAMSFSKGTEITGKWLLNDQ